MMPNDVFDSALIVTEIHQTWRTRILKAFCYISLKLWRVYSHLSLMHLQATCFLTCGALFHAQKCSCPKKGIVFHCSHNDITQAQSFEWLHSYHPCV